MVKIITAERGVAMRGQHFKHAFGQFQNRHIKCPAAQVIHRKRAFFRHVIRIVQTIRNRRRCWLIEQAQHIQSRDVRRILGRLPLRLIKIRRHRNHRADDVIVETLQRALI